MDVGKPHQDRYYFEIGEKMASIKDIAKMAGVSTATVSHVINKTRYVSPELVEKVEQAIKNADSPPKFVVRKQKKIRESIYQSQKKALLYICQYEDDNYAGGVWNKLKPLMENKGYNMIRCNCNNEFEMGLVDKLLRDNKEIIGAFVSVKTDELYIQKIIRSLNIPCVIIGNEVDDSAFDRVSTDVYKAAYDCTMHFIRSGHEKIAILMGDLLKSYNKDFMKGYEKALEDSGIKFKNQYVLHKDGHDKKISDMLSGLLDGKDAPSALLIANSDHIYSLYKYMMRRNIKCPKDLSIMCVGNESSAAYLNPALSMAENDFERIAEKANELMTNKIKELSENDKIEAILKKTSKILISAKMTIRDSIIGTARGPFGEKGADIHMLSLTEKEMDICRMKRYTAVIVYHYIGASFMKLHEQGVRDVFDRLGITVIAVMGCQMDFFMQKKQIQSLLMLEPDIMIAFPVNHTLTQDVFKDVIRTKTKLVFMGHVPNGFEGRGYVSCINVNERSNGRNIGRGLGDYLLLNHKKNIGIIRYGHQFYTTNQRDFAVEQIIREEYPELRICATEVFSKKDEYEKTKELLLWHPEIDGIYVSWEGPAIKVVEALHDIDREDIAVATSDLDFSVALDMAKGGCIKILSAQQPFEEGQAAALCAANALLGKTVPSFIAVEPVFVTAENLIKSWNTIYKSKAPKEIVEALQENEQFMSE